MCYVYVPIYWNWNVGITPLISNIKCWMAWCPFVQSFQVCWNAEEHFSSSSFINSYYFNKTSHSLLLTHEHAQSLQTYRASATLNALQGDTIAQNKLGIEKDR